MNVFRIFRRFTRGKRAVSGLAAAEFAIISPVFFLAMLGMVDIGLALNERMEVDRVLRAGVQEAMSGQDDVSRIEAAVRNANFSSGVSEHTPQYTIARSCECLSTEMSCNALCDDGRPPAIYFDLSAVQPMETFMLPAMNIRSAMRVQVR
jgi:pilus assembly protein CpaE